MTSLQHIKNIESFQKRHNENYVQWVVSAKTNLDYYLESWGGGVQNLQDLKGLMLSVESKDSLSNNIKSYILMKEAMKYLKLVELAKNIDIYVEALHLTRSRYLGSRNYQKPQKEKTFGKGKGKY